MFQFPGTVNTPQQQVGSTLATLPQHNAVMPMPQPVPAQAILPPQANPMAQLIHGMVQMRRQSGEPMPTMHNGAYTNRGGIAGWRADHPRFAAQWPGSR